MPRSRAVVVWATHWAPTTNARTRATATITRSDLPDATDGSAGSAGPAGPTGAPDVGGGTGAMPTRRPSRDAATARARPTAGTTTITTRRRYHPMTPTAWSTTTRVDMPITI